MADINKLQTLIQLRRGFQAQWDAVAETYIPKAGEPCVTLDGKNKGQIKIGDGTSTWGQLKYVGVNEGALHFIGTVSKKTDLPENAETGDIYQVTEDSNLYIWDGDSWEIFHAVDLSNYYTKEETGNLVKVEIGKVNESINELGEKVTANTNKLNEVETKVDEASAKLENLGTELAKDYALKSDLDVIKIYGNTVTDSTMEVNGQKYDTASEAIAAVSDGGVVKMSTGLAENEVVVADKKFTLDMNKASIVDVNNTPISTTINGNLTLTGDGSVNCEKNGSPSVLNNGEMIVENGDYTHKDEKGDTHYAILNHGKMTINNGLFNIDGNVSSLVVNGYYDYTSKNPLIGYVEGVNAASPELVINNGTFITKFIAVKNDDNGKLTINNGKFYGTIQNAGLEVVINDGYFEREWNNEDNLIICTKYETSYNPAKLVINGGTFIGKIEGNVGDVRITGGKFNMDFPAEYIADGYEKNYIDGYYVVSKKV